MTFPGKLLQLSIKTQIISTVILSSIIAVILIYGLINLYIFEIKTQSLKNYKEYYYTIQKEILQNIIRFQNFFLFSFENILINIVGELYVIISLAHYFPEEDVISPFTLKRINYTDESDSIFNISKKNIYYISDKNSSIIEEERNDNFIKVTSKILNDFKSFRIPYLGDRQLFDGVIIYMNSTKELYSLNNSLLYTFLNEEIGGDEINEFYINLSNNISFEIKKSLEKILNDKSIFPELFFEPGLLRLFRSYESSKNIRLFTKYAPYIDYKKEFLHLIRIDDEEQEIFVSAKFKSGLIDEMFMEMAKYFNITTILVSPEDNAVINSMSCNILFTKLQYYYYTQYSEKGFEIFQKQYNKNYEKILNKNATIDNCFLDNENIRVIKYLEQYFIQNNEFFLDIRGEYNFSFIQLSNASVGKQYMVIRYSYPEFFLIERKTPRYIIPKFLNVYTLMNFYFPFTYLEERKEFMSINIYAITLTNWYMWLIIFLIITLICLKISRDITNPLITLKRSIEQMSFNNEKIFEYKDDPNINELFVMCKELVNIDKFKKNMKGKYFFNENKNKEENKNILNNREFNEKVSVFGNRNLIINNQLLEENRKRINDEKKYNFNKEIIEYRDSIFFKSRLRTRTLSRRKARTMNNLFDKKTEKLKNKLESVKTFGRFPTKNYNKKNDIRDNFIKEFSNLNIIKKDSGLSFDEAQLIDKKINKNDNELNILCYGLLFYLGKNMFISNNRNNFKAKEFKYEKTLTSNIDIDINININKKNSNEILVKKTSEDFSNNLSYNNEPLFENNKIDNLYEEKSYEIEKDEKNNLKEEYKIIFDKNNLYYRYLRAKNNPKNIFMQKNKSINGLELGNENIIEIEEEENKELAKKRNEFNRRNLCKTMGSKKDVNRPIMKKKSNIKTNAQKNDKFERKKIKSSSRKSAIPINFLGFSRLSQKQRKLGMRASVSVNVIKHKTINNPLENSKKKTKFNLNINNNLG